MAYMCLFILVSLSKEEEWISRLKRLDEWLHDARRNISLNPNDDKNK